MEMKKITFPMFKKIVNILSEHGIDKSYPINIIWSKIFKYIHPDVAIVLGHRMFLDSEDTLRLSINGVYEPFETELVKRRIRRGDVVLDIGANIGYYTLIFARLVGKEGKVFAFEPEPDNFALLKKNIEINGYRNVEIVKKAVSNMTGKILLYVSEENTGDHRIYNSPEVRRTIEIESIRLDEYFKDYDGKIDFVKMDIQGAEEGALKGMLELLKRTKKIVTEFWPVGLIRFGTSPEDYLTLFLSYGFKLYRINAQAKEIQPISSSELLRLCTPEKETNYANILCVKE